MIRTLRTLKWTFGLGRRDARRGYRMSPRAMSWKFRAAYALGRVFS